jgi:hypothetical protein
MLRRHCCIRSDSTRQLYLECWRAFADMWALLFRATSSSQEVDQQIEAIDNWKKQVSLCNRDMSMHNNSAHVIWHHLPHYLRKYGESGGLGRFSQEGTELQVKLAKEALDRNISKSSLGNTELLERQSTRLMLQMDEARGTPLATPPETLVYKAAQDCKQQRVILCK